MPLTMSVTSSMRHRTCSSLFMKRRSCVQTDLEALEEAQNELMLVDDEDAARYLFGECFVHTATDDADSRIETGAGARSHGVPLPMCVRCLQLVCI